MTTLQRTTRGFTLIEVMVAVVIFAIVMTAAAGVFARSVKSYRYARATQRSLEDVQFAINRIAKSLRTSSVQSVGSGGQSIIIYDYSRGGGACVRYSITPQTVLEEVEPLDYDTYGASGCGEGIFSASSQRANLTTTPVQGAFAATPSVFNTTVGKASVVFVTQDTDGASVRLQTTVSLRDYDVSGVL